MLVSTCRLFAARESTQFPTGQSCSGQPQQSMPKQHVPHQAACTALLQRCQQQLWARPAPRPVALPSTWCALKCRSEASHLFFTGDSCSTECCRHQQAPPTWHAPYRLNAQLAGHAAAAAAHTDCCQAASFDTQTASCLPLGASINDYRLAGYQTSSVTVPSQLTVSNTSASVSGSTLVGTFSTPLAQTGARAIM